MGSILAVCAVAAVVACIAFEAVLGTRWRRRVNARLRAMNMKADDH